MIKFFKNFIKQDPEVAKDEKAKEIGYYCDHNDKGIWKCKVHHLPIHYIPFDKYVSCPECGQIPSGQEDL